MKKEIWFILLCLAVIGILAILAIFLAPTEPFVATVLIMAILTLVWDVAISMRREK